jgi:hypothetical protein
MPKRDFPAVFTELRQVLKAYEPHLAVQHDTPEQYYLNRPSAVDPKPIDFFGAVRMGKNYVSYYLMPVYTFPALLDDLSPELRARMQGKSCFNFKALEPALMKELKRLTQRSFEKWKKEGML